MTADSNPSLRSTVRKALFSGPMAKWKQRYDEWQVAKKIEQPPSHDENGLPIPNAFLITLVAGAIDWRFFLHGGRAAIETFSAAIDRHGGDFKKAERILDFGCGCGRLARHAKDLTDAEYYGVDYNARLVNWCKENLPGHFSQNQLKPPLAFDSDFFDALYLLSVFTHLRLSTQNEWLAEYARVVKPGGIAIITFHDEDHPNIGLTSIDRDTLLADGTAVHNDDAEGSNLIAMYQTRAFAREQFSEYFEVCEIVPSTENKVGQALAILRKAQ